MKGLKRGTGAGIGRRDALRFGWWRAALLLVCAGAGASEFALPKDGWVSWRVDAVAGTPDWCCFSPDQPGAQRQACNLDQRNNSFGSDGESRTDEVVVYALMQDGQATRVRAYGPACPVRAASAIADLGKLDSDASARWLATLTVGTRGDSEALAALAAHAGTVAEDTLAAIATDAGAGKRRLDALFWLGHARGEAGVRRIEPLLSSDPDPKVREHAAFAVSQSGVARRGELLVRQAREDASPTVRSQAWFWLAQSGDARAEGELRTALRAEKSEQVRHQAIFALSQLPDGRGVPALIAVIEDRALAIDDRKQALFWLGHSESGEALAYLDRVLR